MAKTVQKQNKSASKNIKDTSIDFFSNKWISLGVIALFFIVFFRELITGGAFLFDDFAHQYYPGKTMLAVALSKGEIPFWNPYTFSGMPFFADLQIAIFYPFNSILSFFVSGERISPVLLQFTIIIHYLLCSIFSFFIGKHFKLSNFSSIVLSLLFTYSSYNIIHMIHMPLVEALAWFPLVFLLWLKYYDSRKIIYILIAGFLMVLSILAGYPQVAFFNFLFVALYTLVEFVNQVKERDFKFAVTTAIAFAAFVIIAFGMSAFQLLPANEFVTQSNRAFIDNNFAKQGSLHPLDFLTFFMPKIFGVWNWTDSTTDLKYYSTHQEGPWMFSIANAYISTVVIVMLMPVIRYVFSTKKNKKLFIFLISLSVFCFLFALGGNFFFHKLIFDVVPFFNRFRNPAHILYLSTFCLVLMTAFGFEYMHKDRAVFSKFFGKGYFISVLSVLLLFLVLINAGFFKSGQVTSNEQVYGWIKKQYNIFLILTAAFTAVIYLFNLGKIKYQVFTAVIVVLICVDIYVNWYEQNNGSRNPETMYGQSAQTAAKIKEEMKSEYFRVNMREGSAMLFQRNAGMIDRISFLEGYGALILRNYIPFNKPDSGSTQTHDLMNVKYKLNPKTMQLYLNPGYLPRVKMFYDVKYVSRGDTSATRKIMESREFDYRNSIVIESDKKDFSIPGILDTSKTVKPEAKITEYGLNKITVEVNTPENGFLFFSEVYYPAWKALVDGAESEIYITDNSMRSVYLEKGKHKVEMVYSSGTFNTGRNISLTVGAVFLIALGFFGYGELKSRNKKKETQQE